MKTIFAGALLALVPAIGMSMAVPAAAQSRSGIAVVDLQAAAVQSNAYRTAMQQIETTHKATIDNLNARRTALDASIKSKNTAFESAVRAAGNNPTPALQTQYEDLQRTAQSAQEELQRIGQPVALAQAYVGEQIAPRLEAALQAAMNKAKVDLVLSQNATEAFKPNVDITSQVTAELNAVLPNVSITPPAGWRPGQNRAGAAAAPAAAATPAAPTQQPATR